jgi:lipoic acid synthetase
VASSSAPPAPPRFAPKPPWLKVRAPGGESYTHLKDTLRALDLHTVCEEARCPNVGECWAEGRAIAKLGLQYVVLTMVDRDDLLDGGASHVARTVSRLKELRPDLLVETLLGDFGGHLDYVDTTIDARPDVWAHNIEVVRRLQRTIRDVRCSYERSLSVLRRAKERDPSRITKSSVMVGIGETDDEVVETLADLRAAGVDLVTLGQYLRPSPKHAAVDRYVDPATFERFAREASRLGFAYVASAPLVRSSYKAAEVFVRSILRPGDVHGADELLQDRLALAQEAAQKHGGAPRTTSELAARAAKMLLPADRLVRRPET